MTDEERQRAIEELMVDIGGGMKILPYQPGVSPAKYIDYPVHDKFRHTPDMGEISGFGGGYEDTIQNMLSAGTEWLINNPEADIKLKGFEGVYGMVQTNSDDAETLETVITDSVKDKDGKCDITSVMHHDVMMRLLYIHTHSWTEYCDMMRDRDQNLEEVNDET